MKAQESTESGPLDFGAVRAQYKATRHTDECVVVSLDGEEYEVRGVDMARRVLLTADSDLGRLRRQAEHAIASDPTPDKDGLFSARFDAFNGWRVCFRSEVCARHGTTGPASFPHLAAQFMRTRSGDEERLMAMVGGHSFEIHGVSTTAGTGQKLYIAADQRGRFRVNTPLWMVPDQPVDGLVAVPATWFDGWYVDWIDAPDADDRDSWDRKALDARIAERGWVPFEGGLWVAPIENDSVDMPEVTLYSPGDPPGQMWLQWNEGHDWSDGPPAGDPEVYVRLDEIKRIPTPHEATWIVRYLGGNPPSARKSDDE
jgi:hypothetical protein